MHECQNFPGNKIPGQKISRRNVPGQENSGTRKFQEFHFFPEFEKYFFEKIPGFFPAGAENSRTFNPTQFLDNKFCDRIFQDFFYIPEPLRGLSSMNLLNIPKSLGYSGPMKPIAPGYPGPMKRKSPSGYSSKNLLDS